MPPPAAAHGMRRRYACPHGAQLIHLMIGRRGRGLCCARATAGATIDVPGLPDARDRGSTASAAAAKPRASSAWSASCCCKGRPVGDFVIVHLGTAIGTVPPEEAQLAWALLDELLAWNRPLGPNPRRWASDEGKLRRILQRSGTKGPAMGISASDVVPFTQARATLSELAEQVKTGAEKIITRNGRATSP